MKPSQIMMEVLSGRLNHDEAPEPIQSAMRLHYYHAARAVLANPDKESRKSALHELPDSIRSQVEKECIRLWRGNNDKLQ